MLVPRRLQLSTGFVSGSQLWFYLGRNLVFPRNRIGCGVGAVGIGLHYYPLSKYSFGMVDDSLPHGICITREGCGKQDNLLKYSGFSPK